MRHPEMDSFRPAKWVPFAVLGALIVIFLFSCFHVVPPGNRGVSVTFGKVDVRVRGEGITFKKPFIEHIIDFSIRQKTVEGQAAAYSSDLQTVGVSFKALYRIPEEKVVELFQKYSGDPYLSLVEPRIQEELKQTTLLITHNLTEAVQLSDRVLVMTYRPGRIKRIVDVGLPHPRDAEVVSSDAFGHTVAQIWHDLREEASRGIEADEQRVRDGRTA